MAKKYSLKKYRPKRRRLRVSLPLSNKGIYIFLSFVAFIFFAVYITNNVSKIKIKGNIFSNIIQKVTIDIANDKIKQDIMSTLFMYKNTVYVEKIKEDTIKYISQKYPFIKNITIKFNPVTGVLSLKGEILNSIGYISNNKKFILSDGSISLSSYNSPSELIDIRCKNECEFSKKDIDLIKNFLSYKNNFGTNFYLYFSDNKIYANDDEKSIIWGSHNFFNEKMEKINYIVNDARKKITPPLNIDMRYFEEGRILVSPQKK
ncbi:MAG: hypothetical protein K6357_08120 [Elusimicrobiota bacterium]